ncbi:tetratricopeptide repeat protein [Pseudodesulfovibrio sp. zrk46]|uniref:tetratricopeptide repeat protein n=1 Tax=Pseudodesulfovibrio sp. zrk46 TaxID=2725288 RepID=UPI001448FC74|nr:tetratricopeptide repeat protein [Pseudodesulfovibrio sp. zrk46]QJB55983.1 tetratricopeptide repeat protein [Pseudodesulfovibrio sp. zrk46]
MKLLLSIILAAMLVLPGCIESKTPGEEDIERARTAYSKGFYLEAEKDYERYLQVEPQGKNRREAWDRLSEIAVSIKGDLDRAVVLLEAMYLELGVDPEDAWRIMFQLGDVYAQLGNRAKAIESFEKCLVHAMNSPEHTYQTQLRMAKLYRIMGNYELVADTLENCANQAENDDYKANCLYELAQSYSFISNWSQSKRALEMLLELQDVEEETRVLSIFLLADIYENERDYTKTKELLESILETYPNPKVIESRLSSLPYIPPPKIAPPPKN